MRNKFIRTVMLSGGFFNRSRSICNISRPFDSARATLRVTIPANLIKITLSIALVPTIVLAAGGERDPFQPYALSKPTLATSQATTKTTGENTVNITPLTEDSLSSYKVTGLIISPKDSIILIQAHDKHEYFTTIGDKIGSEGGIIKKVSSEGITVDVEGKLVDLTVNKNRLDIQNETTN